MGWLLVLFPEDIYCLLRWTRISVCIPSMDGFLATYWSYTAYFYLFHLWPLWSTLLPPSHPDGQECLSPSMEQPGWWELPWWELWQLPEWELFPHCLSVQDTTGQPERARKCGPAEGCRGPSDKGHEKGEELNAFFAWDHWQGPLLGLPNTCGWQQCL